MLESFLEKIICHTQNWPMYCPVCGQITKITNVDPKNIRESCLCHICRSTNRQRQIAYTLCKKIGISSLKKIKGYRGTIYNTESYGNIHNQLIKNKRYISSEYFGKKYKSGEMIKGFLHQDLMNLSFKNNSIDIILSSDVFEHIPKPYSAHHEVFRILKKHGCHIFTVPFYSNQYKDNNRAFINKKNQIINLKTPIYHLDGIRPKKGTLVYNIFGKEMLSKLEQIGFKVKMQKLSKPFSGIFGNGSIVFIAQKI